MSARKTLLKSQPLASTSASAAACYQANTNNRDGTGNVGASNTSGVFVEQDIFLPYNGHGLSSYAFASAQGASINLLISGISVCSGNGVRLTFYISLNWCQSVKIVR